jgi:hypothetical protein
MILTYLVLVMSSWHLFIKFCTNIRKQAIIFLGIFVLQQGFGCMKCENCLGTVSEEPSNNWGTEFPRNIGPSITLLQYPYFLESFFTQPIVLDHLCKNDALSPARHCGYWQYWYCAILFPSPCLPGEASPSGGLPATKANSLHSAVQCSALWRNIQWSKYVQRIFWFWPDLAKYEYFIRSSLEPLMVKKQLSALDVSFLFCDGVLLVSESLHKQKGT